MKETEKPLSSESEEEEKKVVEKKQEHKKEIVFEPPDAEVDETEFEDDLNEEEVLYLQNTGRFFILDSMRQLDTLFNDLHHAYVETNFKKENSGGMFSRLTTKKKQADSSEESDT